MPTLTSKIITTERSIDINNLLIEVWAIHPKKDILLSSAFTNAEGFFSISYEDKVLNPSPGKATAKVYVKVYKNKQLLKSTKDQPVAILRNKIPPITLSATNREDHTATRTVQGIIATFKGRAIPNLTVKAYNKTARAEQLLGESKTNQKGHYLIQYDAPTNQLTIKAASDIDLLVKVFEKDGDKTSIITSPLIVNALMDEVLNLSVGDGDYQGLDSYTMVHETLEKEIDQKSIPALSDRDALVMANTCDLENEDVSFYILSWQWALQWKAISAELYFGWLKTGLPNQQAALLSTPVDQLIASVDTAISNNFIPDTAVIQKKGLEKIIEQWRIDHIVSAKGEHIERGSIADLLDTSRLDLNQRKKLLTDWENAEGTIEEFWTNKKKELGEEKFDDLDFSLQLGAVTSNHLPLINAIKTRNNINRIQDLAAFKEEDWITLLKDPKINIPDEIPGDNPEMRQKAYAAELKNITEDLIPTAILAQAFKADKDIDSTVLDQFMDRNPDFEFRNKSIRAYLKEKPDALGGLQDAASAQKELEAVQRIFHLTPVTDKFTSAKKLWQNKLHSAYAIKMAGKSELKKLFNDDEDLAERIYNNASRKHSRAQNVKMQLHAFQTPVYAVSPGIKGLLANIETDADLEALFGDQGYCACKHCDSFFSPSAYLTDLFLYLNKVKVAGNAGPDQDTALEKLFKRRPDLGNIQLDCENSHTPLPYIDLVNEVLERAISPIMYANKQVNILGKTFTLPVAKIPQTETDAATLKAYPQHLRKSAYDNLIVENNDQPIGFPWVLPFNLWMLELRTYLNHMGVSRSALMQSILGQGISIPEIAAEYLNIIPEERKILNEAPANAGTTQRYWGTGKEQLKNMKVFMKHTGYSYETCSRLLKMRFIQPRQNIVFNPPSSCLVSDASLPELTDTVLSRIHKFGRMLLRTNEDMHVLDRTIMAFGGKIDDGFLVHYATILKIENQAKIKDRKELLSWWALLDREDYDKDPSLYTRIFMMPEKTPALLLNDDKTELQTQGTQIDPAAAPLNPDIWATILSATKLHSKELELFVQEEFPDGKIVLNLSSLSYLFRTASFCRATNLKMRDYLSLKKILGNKAVAGISETIEPAQTLAFIDQYQVIKKAGLEPELLHYILIHYSRDNAPFALSEMDTEKLAKDLLNTLQPFLNEAFPAGTTSAEIVENKLKLIIGTDNSENSEKADSILKIIDGSTQITDQEQEAVIDNFMVFFRNKPEAKAKLLTGGITDKEERLQYALTAINRYLLENAVLQQMAASFELPQQYVSSLLLTLLHHPSDTASRAIDVFLDDPFIKSDPTTVWTFSTHKNLFTVIVRLHKIAILIEKLSLSLPDLAYIMTTESANTGLPNLNTLPVEATTGTPQVDEWLTLLNLTLLNKEFFKEESTVFNILHLSNDNLFPKEALLQLLANSTGWKQSDIMYLTGSEGMNLAFPQDYRNGKWLISLAETILLVDRVGATARQMKTWVSPTITKTQADAVRQAAMAKYGEEQWQEITVPLRHNIREAQRDALVQYVLHHVKKHSGGKFEDLDDIYSYYLIDTQMAACTDTSRIVLASSSVQLFVQRIMMNLEPGMSLPDDFIREWKWRKYYRIWEANRKVFMWPENWIEPELRDDKTPLFKELENNLMQGELSTENIEQSLVGYLENLHELAYPKVVGMYQDEVNFHVIAHTPGTPAKYYYRRWEDQFQWTPWEKIELDIFNGEEIEGGEKGILITPVVHNRRLFLFWPLFKIKKEKPTPEDEGLIEAKKQEIDEENAHVRKHERTINKLSREIDSLKKTRDDIEYIQKAIGLSESVWEGIMSKIDDNIDDIEANINSESDYITTHKSNIRKLEEKVRKLEQGYLRYQITMAWSQYRDGHWTPKKMSAGAIETPIFKGDFKNGLAINRYTIRPNENDDGTIAFTVYYRVSNISGENSNSYANAPVYEVINIADSFRYNDCKSELEVVDGKLTNSREMKYAGKFMKLIIGERPFCLTVGNDAQIALLDKNYSKSTQIKSFQGGTGSLYRTIHPFFYDDQQHLYFITPPSLNLAAGKRTSQVMSGVIGSGTNTLRNRSQNFAMNTEHAGQSTGIHLIQGNELNASFFSSAQSGQVIVRSKNERQLKANLSASFTSVNSVLGQAKPSATLSGLKGKFINIASGYRFYPFYHPYTCLFLKQLNTYGLEGLFSPDLHTAGGKELQHQATPSQKGQQYFKDRYKPNLAEVSLLYAKEEIDFSHGHAYATYNWEIFYHIPLYIATRLMQDQRFNEAQQWFHYIFDPTETTGEIPYRFWKIKPFHTYTTEAIKNDLEAVMKGGEAIQKQIKAWEANPFNPHLLARFRKLAYMKTVVMKYLDNLIAWGDQLFRMDSIESMNEATQLYILAGQILGKLPVETEAKPRPSKTFNELAEQLTALGNAWVDIENNMADEYEDDDDAITFSSTKNKYKIKKNNNFYKVKNNKYKMAEVPATISILDDILYFCMSPNEKLLSYWVTVADRLFKIRHCMNIEGIVRSVPLFQPPIDPALLVKAVASGVDISSAVNDLYAPMPYYRFHVLIQKAQEICQELKSLGASLLSALEKKDAEQIAMIRSQHEIQLLEANKDIRKLQLEDARLSILALEESQELARIRYDNYSDRDFISPGEVAAMVLSAGATVMQAIAAAVSAGGAVTAQTPDIHVGIHAQSLASGSSVITVMPGSGNKNSETAKSSSKVFDVLAIIGKDMANNVSTLSGYERRMEEWDLQIKLAEQEIKQLDKQILGAMVRKEITAKEKDNLDLQIENARQVEDFLRNKYTNKELYAWMTGQISAIYFQTYKMAYDLAKQAEKAFRFELGIASSDYIRFGYWDNMRKGLLSGEKLFYDIKRLDIAYLEKNKRDYEITKHISLALLDPLALIQLKVSGSCTFRVPEVLFDMDHPGHYFRRIKSIGISIPCIAGPHTSVSASLSLMSHKYRKNTNPDNTAGDGYASESSQDERFVYNFGSIQSIAISNAQNDSGIFEINFRDERYLPFENAGADSTWKLEFPTSVKQFNYNTIADVILHMRYTAREGGAALKSASNSALREQLELVNGQLHRDGLNVAINMNHEMPNEWHLLKKNGTINLIIDKSRLPYMAQSSASSEIENVRLVAIVKNSPPSFKITINDEIKEFSKENIENIFKTEITGIELGKPFTVSVLNADNLKLEELMLIVKYKF